jgi:F-type H+-transporting ATPase subunit delta
MNVKNAKIAQPYAEALLELTSKDSLEKVINDINYISSSVSNSEELQKTLSNPLLNSKTKKNIIKSIFNDKVDNKTLKFLLVLCDRGRISYLSTILNKAIELAYKASAIEIVKITTSTPLTASQQDGLIGKLKKMTGAQEIKLNISIDPNLIAGFVIQIKSKVIDTSIQGQLKQLSSYLGVSSTQ